MEFLKKGRDRFFLNMELLGTPVAQLWIGFAPDGPTDNDDARVRREREEYERKKAAGLTKRPGGVNAQEVRESIDEKGWYEVDTSGWEAGVYRLNIHGPAGIQAPHGTKLRSIRDGEYSWPGFPEDLASLPDEQQRYLYLERNDAGFCIRIEVTSDREILPAGDGPEWVHRWPEISGGAVARHYTQKENAAGR